MPMLESFAEYESNVRHQLDGCVEREPRYSQLLVRQLAIGLAFRALDVHAIYDVVALLEGKMSRGMPTKKAKPLLKAPLLGLWHKHFFQASFMMRNLVNQWGRDKSFQGVTDRFPVGSDITEIAGELSHMLTVETFCNRVQAKKLTGEWLVFAKHEGKNYYLTLGVHGDDLNTRRNVDSCIVDFPWLSQTLCPVDA